MTKSQASELLRLIGILEADLGIEVHGFYHRLRRDGAPCVHHSPADLVRMAVRQPREPELGVEMPTTSKTSVDSA